MDQLDRRSYPVTIAWLGTSVIGSYLTTYRRISSSNMSFEPSLILQGEVWRLVTPFLDFEELGVVSVIGIYAKVLSLGSFEASFYTQRDCFPPRTIDTLTDEESAKMEKELHMYKTFDFIYYFLSCIVVVLMSSFTFYYFTGLYLKNLSDTLEDVILYRFFKTEPQLVQNFLIVFNIKAQYIILVRIVTSWMKTTQFYLIINYILKGEFIVSWNLFCRDPIIVRAVTSILLGHMFWFLLDYHRILQTKHVLEPLKRHKLLGNFGIRESMWTKMSRYCVLAPWYWKYL